MLRVFLILGLSLAASQGDDGYKRVCYFNNQSRQRPGTGRFKLADIQPDLCNHLIFAYAKLQGNQLTTLEANDEQTYREFTGLKANHPGLKTTLSVGGYATGSAPFSNMASNATNRASFIQSTISFLRSQEFDGIDIVWEYPGTRGGGPHDKENLALLLKEMREAFDNEGAATGREKLLISAAVPAAKPYIDAGFDITTAGANVDFINLKTYDFHGSWEKTTGENSPLFASSSESGMNAQLNTAWAAQYWASQGAPKDKIIVGMPFYGRTFELSPWAYDTGVTAQVSGPGAAGQFTGENGTLAYFEICKMQEAGGLVAWNAEQHVPYYVNGDLWVGYDNVKSVMEKSKWIKQEGFGGAMAWSIDQDDFRQTCASSSSPYPLLSAMNDGLQDDVPQQNTTNMTSPRPPVPTPAPTVQAITTTMPPRPPVPTPAPTVQAITTTMPPRPPVPTPAPTVQASTNATSPRPSVPTPAPTVQAITTTMPPRPPVPTPAPTVQAITNATSPRPSVHTPAPTVQAITTTMPPRPPVPTPAPTVQAITTTLPPRPSVPTPAPTVQAITTTMPPRPSVPTPAPTVQAITTTLPPRPSVPTPAPTVQSTNSPTSPRPSVPTPAPTQPPTTQPPTTQPPTTTTVATTTMPLTTTTQATTTTTAATTPPPTTTTQPTTTLRNILTTPASSGNGFSCSSDGFFADPSTCNKFYRCMSGQKFHFDCNVGTVYNPSLMECDWPFNVPGCQNGGPGASLIG